MALRLRVIALQSIRINLSSQEQMPLQNIHADLLPMVMNWFPHLALLEQCAGILCIAGAQQKSMKGLLIVASKRAVSLGRAMNLAIAGHHCTKKSAEQRSSRVV